MSTHPRRFYVPTVSPLRALPESVLLGLVMLLGLGALGPQLQSNVVSNGILFISGIVALWLALRLAWPSLPLLPHLIEIAVVGLALSILLTGLVWFILDLFGWTRFLEGTTVGWFGAMLTLALSGPFFWLFRLALRLWFFWDGLRRRHLLWSLTHAHLTVVAVVVVLMAALVTVLFFSGAPADSLPPGSLAWLVTRFMTRLFPLASVMLLGILFLLLVLLPPSALVSFFVARQTTRRLERLSRVTAALRGGDYRARVQVSGEDEVAQVESDLNAMADELERTLNALQAQRDQVAALLESRRALVANVSHDLRTPVATVRGYLESALGNWPDGAAPPATLRHDLEVIDAQVAQLQNLIADLFTLARADVRQLPLDCKPVDVGPLITRVVEAHAPLAWQTGKVEVVADVDAGLPFVRADSTRLEQVLSNLLRNALGHTPPGGIVNLHACTEAEGVVIQVRDTGEGISADDLPHIWERFYRGRDSSGRAGAGAGLGLALVKELVEAMNGSVSVTSQRGEGSCFAVRLPRATT